MNLRYLHFGVIDPATPCKNSRVDTCNRWADVDECPVLFTLTTNNQPAVTIFAPPSVDRTKCINEKNKQDAHVRYIPRQENRPQKTSVYVHRNIIIYGLGMRKGQIYRGLDEMLKIKEATMAAMRSILPVETTQSSNDIFIQGRKVLGFSVMPLGYLWGLNMSMDYDLMDRMITPEYIEKSKGKPYKAREITIGLWDVCPEAKEEDFLLPFAQAFAREANLDLVVDTLRPHEQAKINDMISIGTDLTKIDVREDLTIYRESDLWQKA